MVALPKVTSAMKRRRMDDIYAPVGQRLRVYFPHGEGPRILEPTGTTRCSKSGVAELDYEMRGPGTRVWVPGWYVAQPVR